MSRATPSVAKHPMQRKCRMTTSPFIFTTDVLSEAFWVQSGLILLGLGTFLYVFLFLAPKSILRHAASVSLLLSALSFVTALVFRSLAATYFALSNMYEAILVIAIALSLAYLLFERWFKIHTLGWAICLITLIMVFYAGFLPTQINPLQPALQSYWRMIHVPPMMFSYAFFTLAFLSAAAYIITGWGKPDSVQPGRELFATAEGPSESSGSGSVMSRLALYDEITYRAIAAGFPFLLIGTILGGVWANEAWGNYWSWDPKESASLMTLLGYGAYLHMRIHGGHSKRTLAWVAVGGFVLVLVTFVGVNVMGLGMHSYGAIK
jgi:cytochrome c-type biogenesis protein CcsB